MKKTNKAARAGTPRAAHSGLSIRLSPVALSVAIALTVPGYAYAQDAAAPAAQAVAPAPDAAAPADEQKTEKDEALDLGTIVVTAASAQKSKLESSLSVTDVSSQLVEAMNPQSQAEVLRLIPGMIVGDTAGAGGNANISVRGLPITTGGSPFVQLQEDGLPTVLFGDMNFGNNDYWIRFDTSNTIEAVRGGSASTLASGAPGAVINYISATGKEKGGQFTLSEGLGYKETKATFAVGGPLTDSWRFHADGFAVQGNGIRDQGFQSEKGYQIKANVTKELEGGKGYIRFNVKLLDDMEPTNTSYPVQANGGGNSFSGLSGYPGFDSRTGSTLGVYNQTFNVMNSTTGALSQVPASGIHPQAQAFGTEIHYLPAENIVLDDKFRYTVMSGTFSTQFMGYTTASAITTPSRNGSGAITNLLNGNYMPSYLTYAQGPNAYTNFGVAPTAAQTYTGAVNSGTQIYTHMGDMGNVANDLSISDKFKFSPADQLSVKGGLFYMNQTIAQDWHPNAQFQTLSGSNPIALDVWTTQQASSGNNTVLSTIPATRLTNSGVAGYNSAWGSGVDRAYDMHVADTAPYLDLTWDHDSLTLEGSLRQDFLDVTGWAESASGTPTQTINGAIVSTATLDPKTYEALNYGINYRSWSLGALYLLNDDTSAFVRASRGGKANTDRNILSGYTNSDGSLNSSGRAKAVDFVLQQEVGIKTRGYVGTGGYGLEATLFHDSFSVSNFDLTQNINGVYGVYYDEAYSAKGIELEGSFKQGGLNVVGQLTYTKANVDRNAQGTNPAALASSGTGFPPPNTPDLTWMISPMYTYGPATGGLVIQGQGKSNISSAVAYYAPPQEVVDAFVTYDFAKNMSLGLHVNNLFNSIGVNGHADSIPANGPAVITAPAEYGRAANLSLTVKF